MRRIFVTGIGTEVGKTVAAAVLAEGLRADYWKPVQAGSLECSDSDLVRALLSNQESVVHAEQFRLKLPVSPHAAAAAEALSLQVSDFLPPRTERPLIIEGAGGVLVPLNARETIADLIKHLQAEAVLVSRFYLGSINHTLLSVEALRARGIPLLGIVFNGAPNPASEEAILGHSGAACLGHIEPEAVIDRATIKRYAGRFRL